MTDTITAKEVRKASDLMRTSGALGPKAKKKHFVGNGWFDECYVAVRTAAGAAANGNDAIHGWLSVSKKLRHTDGSVPPEGVAVFWKSKPAADGTEGNGHAVVSRGDWSCNTTDFVRNGFIDIADIRDIGVKKWTGLTYLGWAEVVNGVQIVEIDTGGAHLPKGTKVSLTNVRNAFKGMLSDPDVVAVKAALHAEGLLPKFWKGPKVGKTTRHAYAEWQILFSTKGRQEAAGIPTGTDLRALGEKQGFKVEA